jgi:hypothetical protein
MGKYKVYISSTSIGTPATDTGLIYAPKRGTGGNISIKKVNDTTIKLISLNSSLTANLNPKEIKNKLPNDIQKYMSDAENYCMSARLDYITGYGDSFDRGYTTWGKFVK